MGRCCCCCSHVITHRYNAVRGHRTGSNTWCSPRGYVLMVTHRKSLTRVTKSYLLALGTTQISSFFTKHRTKLLTRQTGNYPVTCFGSKPSRITLVESSIINTSYQKLPVINKLKISPRRDSNSRTNTSCIRGLPLVHRGDLHRTSKTTLNTN